MLTQYLVFRAIRMYLQLGFVLVAEACNQTWQGHGKACLWSI